MENKPPKCGANGRTGGSQPEEQGPALQTVEGTLTTLREDQGTRFYVIEGESGRLFACHFASDKIAQQAATLWHDRVRIQGHHCGIHSGRTPCAIKVVALEQLDVQTEWDTDWGDDSPHKDPPHEAG